VCPRGTPIHETSAKSTPTARRDRASTGRTGEATFAEVPCLSFPPDENGTTQVFLDEVKNVSGSVGASKFTSFAMGKGGNKVFELNLAKAEQAVRGSGISRDLKETALEALQTKGFQIRLVGSEAKSTVFRDAAVAKIEQATGVSVAERVLIRVPQ
jgi:predicted GNAT family acetyltransferase